MTKTGECFYRDEEGFLWCAESFENENGEVITTTTKVEEQSK